MSHQEAASSALRHLDEAVADLRAAYDHPHFGERLDNLESWVMNLKSVIGRMPEQEASRAEYAARLLAMHKARELPVHLPEHADRLLDQELERI